VTLYEIQNDAGEVVAVVVKMPDGTCLLKHARTRFESVEQIGRYLNNGMNLKEVKGTYYEQAKQAAN
jgi:hypothetical protein